MSNPREVPPRYVDVDPARRDDPAGGVDRLARGPDVFAHLDDAASGDCHVSRDGLGPAAVDDRSPADHEIVHLTMISDSCAGE